MSVKKVVKKIKKKAIHAAIGVAGLATGLGIAAMDNTGFGGKKISICNGKERWIVKTLQDDDAGDIKFNARNNVTVKELISHAREDDKDIKWNAKDTSRRLHDEHEVYTVECKIADVIPQNDGDVHLVLTDVSGRDSFVGEIPNPDCENVIRYKGLEEDNPNLELIRKSRTNFLNTYLDNYKKGTFIVRGVLFFDTKSHGKGGNDNGVELHPVLSIKRK